MLCTRTEYLGHNTCKPCMKSLQVRLFTSSMSHEAVQVQLHSAEHGMANAQGSRPRAREMHRYRTTLDMHWMYSVLRTRTGEWCYAMAGATGEANEDRPRKV
jgi:hypothetical protein